MTAAVYCRKSTTQDHISDEAKAVARQLEHARAYAARKGWTVAEDHVYVDDGISGAEFAKRPGVVRLMNALTPRPAFQVLVMSEESRLGREQIETAYMLKQLITAGVRVFYYLEDRERTLNGALEKAMMALQGMADEMEREKARQRVTDAMVRKARAGLVCGGRVFAYSNVRIDASTVVRRVNEAEAAVVRQIFTLSAQGCGLKQIAHQLNEAGALAPRAQQARPAGWAPSSVREVLLRPLYRGSVVYNRTRKRDGWGRKAQTPRPEAEWITVDVPGLRIVSEELWEATHSRMRARRALYAPEADSATTGPHGRKTGGPSRYLLSRLARCGVCGSGFAMRSRSHGSQRNYRYGCVCNWNRGRRACANNREVPLTTADATVLGALGAELLRPAVVDAAVEQVVAACETDRDATARRRMVDREIASLDRELENLVAAVAGGGDAARLLAAMRERETRRAAAVLERDRLADVPASGLDAAEIRRRLRAKMAECRTLLTGDVMGARRLLELLLDGFITFTPAKNRHGFDAYHVRIPLRLDRVFETVVCQDVWRPRRDSETFGRPLSRLGCCA